MSSHSSAAVHRIGVVGGGIAGSVAAAELSRHFETVVLWDQGRGGPGGRSSHRSVDVDNFQVLPDDDNDIDVNTGKTFEFDHGCQFFRADTPRMQALAEDWRERGWVQEWRPRVMTSGRGHAAQKSFFGIPHRDEPIYIGVGGMHQIPRKLLSNSAVDVRRGTRVAGVRPSSSDDSGAAWDLLGVSGTAAYHDTSEAEASKSSTTAVLGTVDAVVFTDISSTFDSWHRASAGIPDSFRQRVRKRPRVALFSCLVALNRPIRDALSYDAIVPDDANQDLWFAACSQSKPGFPSANETTSAECWTLISTPSFAVRQIQDTTMQDPTTGKFKPQEDDYLNSVPGPQLWGAFRETIRPLLQQHSRGDDHAGEKLEPIYLQAHRWGSSLPAPDGTLPENSENICGVDYLNHDSFELVYDRPETAHYPDYVADDELRLYYAGDFCSYRNPGFEASALSGIDVAERIIRELGGN